MFKLLEFRSQFAFYFLNLYNRDLDIYWHFLEANHGKGAVDGIGGTIKHRVYREVLAKRIVVKDSKDFAEHANRLLDHIEVLFVENVDAAVDTESRENAQYVKGTLKVHKVVRELDTANKKSQLQFYYNSNELTPFCTKSFELVERLVTEQVREVPKQRKTTTKKQKKTTAKSAKKSVPAKAKLRVSEVYSDVESDTETGAIKDVDERVQLTEVWTSISPLAKETDVIGKWFAAAYKPTSKSKKLSKESLYIGRATKRFLKEEGGGVEALELDFLKPHVGSTSVHAEYPKGHCDIFVCNVTDVLGGPLNVKYLGNGKWDVIDLKSIEQFFSKVMDVARVDW